MLACCPISSDIMTVLASPNSISRRRRIWRTTSRAYPHNYSVIQYNDFNVAGSFTGGVEAVTKMRELAQGPEEWVVIVDLDEFVEFPEPVTALVEKVEAEGANIARGVMYDRFAIDGRLKDFADNSDLSCAFPGESPL